MWRPELVLEAARAHRGRRYRYVAGQGYHSSGATLLDNWLDREEAPTLAKLLANADLMKKAKVALHLMMNGQESFIVKYFTIMTEAEIAAAAVAGDNRAEAVDEADEADEAVAEADEAVAEADEAVAEADNVKAGGAEEAQRVAAHPAADRASAAAAADRLLRDIDRLGQRLVVERASTTVDTSRESGHVTHALVRDLHAAVGGGGGGGDPLGLRFGTAAVRDRASEPRRDGRCEQRLQWGGRSFPVDVYGHARAADGTDVYVLAECKANADKGSLDKAYGQLDSGRRAIEAAHAAAYPATSGGGAPHPPLLLCIAAFPERPGDAWIDRHTARGDHVYWVGMDAGAKRALFAGLSAALGAEPPR